MKPRRIVALGGGGFLMEPDNPLLDRYVVSLCDRLKPRVCFIPTASGDRVDTVTSFYKAFPAGRCEAAHLPLFGRTVADLRAFVLAQDIVYVGGGSTANMLAVWRVHGLDVILREAWERGVVLAGVSAGALCWFEQGITDSFGPELARIDDGLGLVGGSFCPHYANEGPRVPTFRRHIAGGMKTGLAADDGAALSFIGAKLVEIVTSRPEARAYRVEHLDGEIVETPLRARYLGSAE